MTAELKLTQQGPTLVLTLSNPAITTLRMAVDWLACANAVIPAA